LIICEEEETWLRNKRLIRHSTLNLIGLLDLRRIQKKNDLFDHCRKVIHFGLTQLRGGCGLAGSAKYWVKQSLRGGIILAKDKPEAVDITL
jgi:hypothetical protein